MIRIHNLNIKLGMFEIKNVRIGSLYNMSHSDFGVPKEIAIIIGIVVFVAGVIFGKIKGI